MDSSSGDCSRYNELESIDSLLIPGLPDDIALFCLARVPRNHHLTLKCVSKRWRNMVCSEEWRSYREKHNLAETWIYALCRDTSRDQVHCCVLDLSSSKKRWRPIRGVPSCCLKRKGMGFETLGNKLYLLGGCGWSQDDSDEVYCYDASMNTWSQVASMSTPRSYFGCKALDGKIYAIGGNVLDTHGLPSCDMYNPSSNSWESRSDQSVIFDIEDSFVMDEKMYVRSCVSAIPPYIYIAVYNPSTGNWASQTDTDIAFGWRGPAVVVDDNLYVLDQSSGTKLMMWHKGAREWIFKCRLSPLLTRPPCQMVSVGRNIYILGKGLSTIVLDVDDISNANGVIPSSSIPIFCFGYDVISCRCLSI